jgi:hypothetical protein
MQQRVGCLPQVTVQASRTINRPAIDIATTTSGSDTRHVKTGALLRSRAVLLRSITATAPESCCGHVELDLAVECLAEQPYIDHVGLMQPRTPIYANGSSGEAAVQHASTQ